MRPYRPAPPAAIGPWTVVERLGAGSAADVFRCRRGGREAAVKILRTGLRGEPASEAPGRDPAQLLRRLAREAGILGRLDHPNIVRVRSVELREDPAWIVMDYVPGRHAGFVIRAGPADPALVRRTARALLSAMDHWHRAGIAHRDIKPGNLMFNPDGHLVVVDFGLALDAAAERLSGAGVRVGTCAYAPPEWATPDGGEPHGWDLYAAGQVMHELLVGRRSFASRESPLAIVKQKLAQEHFDPGPAAPADLRAVVCSLTARDPAHRPPTAADARAGLAP